MTSEVITIRFPSALVECLPYRIRDLRLEVGEISRNAYFISLVRSDLINPVNTSAGLDVAARQFYYQDKIDQKIIERWLPPDVRKTPALLRRVAV